MSRIRVLLATRSTDKLREIHQILQPSGFELVSLRDLGIQPSPEEDEIEAFDTFRENAAAKARYFLRLSGLPSLADDSGVAVDALGGAPGVRSKRFASDAGAAGADDAASDAAAEGGELDRANNALLLRRLGDTPPNERTARYVCAAVLALPRQGVIGSIGTCEGRILESPRGTGGFGYDPLFAPLGSDLSFGQLDSAAKNLVSHRARAFRAIASLAGDALR